MRFLIDAQPPPPLARWLEDQGHVAAHVVDCGLLAADDREIWDYALNLHAAVVTKDEDFAIRRAAAATGPPVVWVRRGNTTRRELLLWFAPLLPDIVDALSSGERLVEIV